MQKNYQIKYLITAVNSKAPIKIATGLAKYFCESNNVEIVYLNKKKSEDKIIQELIKKGIKVKKISFNDILNTNKMSVVHSHGFLPDLILSFSKFIFPFKYRNTKAITTLHSDIDIDIKDRLSKKYSKIICFIWKLLLRKLDHVVFLNKFTQEKYKKYTVDNSIVWNGLDLHDKKNNFYHEKIKSFSKGKFIIGSYGVLRKIKGFDTIIIAATKIENCCFIIAGDGPEKKQLTELIEKNKLKDKVLLLGNVDNAHQLIKYFDISVLPSKSEGFPLTAIEYIWANKKIICSDIPQFREIFSPLLDVEYFNSEDPNSLANTIQTAIKKIEYKTEDYTLYYKKNLTVERMAKKYEEIYKA
ncbi:UDP-N-acetylglucosamine--peptide N-acetylglucosaminyltransferase GtfA subunit [Providencia alcalifaciens]|uniref:Glycosyl transferase, group 1 n=3 Tax=Providencia alcalifaciens TaxID=126385 RepID=A0A346CL82_9GAMM|nr:glycosyltransferase [Providencia alcalifaciens]AXL96356.1 glycosyl transferase, group 1 [Providencia alcalifaciens]EUD04652.1 glycosyltransferase, group 1 family protein [Providencia alcalifaciens RIMD 1656011]EUD10637.1 glycosyltransferase, group 1 family protein [Providencia alcalifaciens 205/92]MTC62081.1 glycosyltransferase [Providencia alcalifaciens]WGZ55601.1 glycosyltransferase [Providencia alcalifaciens]